MVGARARAVRAGVPPGAWTGEGGLSRLYANAAAHGVHPDMSLVQATRRLVDGTGAPVWVLENTKGGHRWITPEIGAPSQVVYRGQNPVWYLWGQFPHFPVETVMTRGKEGMSSSWAAARSEIPQEISRPFMRTVLQRFGLPALGALAGIVGHVSGAYAAGNTAQRLYEGDYPGALDSGVGFFPPVAALKAGIEAYPGFDPRKMAALSDLPNALRTGDWGVGPLEHVARAAQKGIGSHE